VSAVAWTGTDAIARIGLQFAITVVLARILTPDDFGVIGLVSLFMAVSYILADSSLSAGLIQRKTITSDDSLSVLVVNFSLSLFLGALLCSIAQSFAEFFARPVLAQLTFLLAATLVVTSVSSVPRALLTRDLKFRSIALSSVVANSLAGMVAIGLAYAGFGVWSLAVQGFIAACVSTIMLWISCGTLRGARFRVSSIRSLASFGVYLMASDLLVTISTRLHTLLIGKMYSTSDLGFYMRAENVQHLPVSLITKVISKVAFPIFSRHQDQRDVLAAGVKKASSVVMVLNAPIMVGIVHSDTLSRGLVLATSVYQRQCFESARSCSSGLSS
jgi:O-antigen/teichoic acid export membrane protein